MTTMKNALLPYFLNIIWIYMVNGQPFLGRQFLEGPPPPPQQLPLYGNRRFFNEAIMQPYPRPPPPMMFKGEGPQVPILYRQGNIQRGPLFRNLGPHPQPTFFAEEGLQSPPIFYRENVVLPKPNFYREESVPSSNPTLYHKPNFQPVPELYHEEPIERNPVLYREGGLLQQQSPFQDENRYQTPPRVHGVETTEKRVLQQSSETHSPCLINRDHSKPKSLLSKIRARNCLPSVPPPLKMNIEPSKENFNTLRTALRAPFKEPSRESEQNKIQPTIIIQESVESPTTEQENSEVYIEDDYSDHYVDETELPIPEPTLLNYPYQYFQPIKLCNNNGMIQVTSSSTPCISSLRSDWEDIMPVLRSPITILPSRFPPGIESIIEKIQKYFSTYNHIENAQRPMMKPSTTYMPTTTSSMPVSTLGSSTVTKRPLILTTQNENVNFSSIPAVTSDSFTASQSHSVSPKPTPTAESKFEISNRPTSTFEQQTSTTSIRPFTVSEPTTSIRPFTVSEPTTSIRPFTVSKPTTDPTGSMDSKLYLKYNPDAALNEIGPNENESSTFISSTSTETEAIEIVDQIQTTPRSESKADKCSSKSTNGDVGKGNNQEDVQTTTAATTVGNKQNC